VCHLALFLASKALFVSDPHLIKQYSNDRSRVVHFPHPNMCVLVVARSDDDHLVDASPTLDDASGGGPFMTPTFIMALPLLTSIGFFAHLFQVLRLSLPSQVHSLYPLLRFYDTGFPDLGVVGDVLPLTLVFWCYMCEGQVP
jgi:hypothetical protein